MFGYVVVNKPDLKFKEFDVYQSYYCGLCKTLKNNYGVKGQLTLNYDLNFLVILLSSLYEPNEETFKESCIVHPLKKHLKIVNEFSNYAADFTIVLSYFKCLDDYMDENKLIEKTFMQLLKKHYLNIEKKYPIKVQLIKDNLMKINQYEKENNQNIDEVANLFGEIMGTIFNYQNDIFSTYLYNLGFYLGKFIYLIDAYEDVEKDIKNKNYNLFKEQYKNNVLDEYFLTIGEYMLGEASEAYNMLPIVENNELLKNIIYCGIWTKYEYVKNKRKQVVNDK
ncbi:MAG: DUF5685 family protein [Erysipelotrichaceae bacterium]